MKLLLSGAALAFFVVAYQILDSIKVDNMISAGRKSVRKLTLQVAGTLLHLRRAASWGNPEFCTRPTWKRHACSD